MPTKPRSMGYYVVQAVTLARLPISIAFAVILLAAPESPSVLVSLVLLIGAEITDILDGTLARRTGHVSEFGAMFDPYVDSVSRLIVFWALACAGLVWAVVPLGMAIRDITVAYARIELARAGHSVSAMIWGKLKAIIQGGGAPTAVAFHVWFPDHTVLVRDFVSGFVLAVTLASAVQYVRAAMRVGSPR